jgi:hypothetical protein
VRLAVVRTRLRDEAIFGMGLPRVLKRGGAIAFRSPSVKHEVNQTGISIAS